MGWTDGGAAKITKPSLLISDSAAPSASGAGFEMFTAWPFVGVGSGSVAYYRSVGSTQLSRALTYDSFLFGFAPSGTTLNYLWLGQDERCFGLIRICVGLVLRGGNNLGSFFGILTRHEGKGTGVRKQRGLGL